MIARVFHFEKLLKKIELNSEDIHIGRSSECEIVINEPLISRKHCKICFKKNQYVIHDLGSVSGITVMGSRIEKNGSLTIPLSLSFEIIDEYRIEFENEADAKIKVQPVIRRKQVPLKETLKENRPPKKKKKDLKLAFYLILVLCLAFTYIKKSDNLQVDRQPASKEIPSLRTLSLQVLSPDELIKKMSTLNCNKKKLCRDLFLNKDYGEGIIINEGYVVIALKLNNTQKLIKEEKDKLDIIHLSLIGLNPLLTKELTNQTQIYVIGLREGEMPLISYMPNIKSKDRKEFDSNLQNYLLKKSIDDTYQWTKSNGVVTI